jgi:hypothetical protein
LFFPLLLCWIFWTISSFVIKCLMAIMLLSNNSMITAAEQRLKLLKTAPGIGQHSFVMSKSRAEPVRHSVRSHSLTISVGVESIRPIWLTGCDPRAVAPPMNARRLELGRLPAGLFQVRESRKRTFVQLAAEAQRPTSGRSALQKRSPKPDIHSFDANANLPGPSVIGVAWGY